MAEDRRDLWKTTSIGLVIAAIVAGLRQQEARRGIPLRYAGCMKAKGYTG